VSLAMTFLIGVGICVMSGVVFIALFSAQHRREVRDMQEADAKWWAELKERRQYYTERLNQK